MGKPAEPRITFGMIVLNGEPFLLYNLRALYPFAHQIIVVEGACPSAKEIATRDGHSSDNTLSVLRRFQQEEDSERKLTIVTAENEGHPDGFWSEKDEMSQAYANRATGNYLWQIDSDEFYMPEDMVAVIEMLRSTRHITAATFPMHTFWGGLNYRVDSLYLRAFEVHRLFAWGEGYRYVSHRRPIVVDERGVDLRSINSLSAKVLARRNVYMYHYELLFPKQVVDKCKYYSKVPWSGYLRSLPQWVEECYLELRRPYRVHMIFAQPSWLERFRSVHPPQVQEMVKAVEEGRYPGFGPRRTNDIEELLSRPSYWIGRNVLKAWSRVSLPLQKIVGGLRRVLGPTFVGSIYRAMRPRKRVESH